MYPMKTTTNTETELTESRTDRCNVTDTFGIVKVAEGWLVLSYSMSRTLKTRAGALRALRKINPEGVARLEALPAGVVHS